MKKNLKRTLAKVMAVALTVALAGTAAPEADAAKKMKLSSKSITVEKGKTKKVTIKNVKKNQVKKLTVKSSKAKVAAVKKSGKTAFKVTGKKAGKANITASVTVKGKKKATKLTLKVKVQNAAAPTPAPTTAPTAAVTTAPATTAPATTTAPAGNNPGGNNPGGSNTQAPATTTPATTTKPPVTQKPKEEYIETAIQNIQLGGKNSDKATYFDVKDGTATVILNDGAQYGGVYTYFDVELGAGSKVEDIKKISFDFEGVTGDLGYKKFWLLGGNPDSASLNKFPDEISYAYNDGIFENITEVDTEEGISWNGEGEYSEEFTVDTAKLLDEVDDLTNKVRFCIYVNLAGTGSGENTQYKLGNIKVHSIKDKTMKDGNAAPGAKVDNTSDIAVGAVLNLKSNVLISTPEEATVTISNAGIVGEIASVVWASSDTAVAEVAADAAVKGKATVTGKKAGKATITATVTTDREREVTLTKVVTVSETAIVIEDVKKDLTENNTVKIDKDKAAYSGGGAIGIAELLDGYEISDYAALVIKGHIKYAGDDVTATSMAQGNICTDTNSWGGTGLLGDSEKYNLSTTGTSNSLGDGWVIELTPDRAAKIQAAVEAGTFGVAFQNSMALDDGDMVFTITSIELKASLDEEGEE